MSDESEVMTATPDWSWSERVNHQGFSVEPQMFDTFYLTVMATFTNFLGADWTAEIEHI